MSEDTDLPFICPSCGQKFGCGPDVALLTVVNSAPFKEKLPCCGVRVEGVVVRNDYGYMEIESMEICEVKQ